MPLTFTPDEELAMEQVGTGECGVMSPQIADHVHRVGAHALFRCNAQLHAELDQARRERDAARAVLARFLQQVRSVTLDVLAEEQAHA